MQSDHLRCAQQVILVILLYWNKCIDTTVDNKYILNVYVNNKVSFPQYLFSLTEGDENVEVKCLQPSNGEV